MVIIGIRVLAEFLVFSDSGESMSDTGKLVWRFLNMEHFRIYGFRYSGVEKRLFVAVLVLLGSKGFLVKT